MLQVDTNGTKPSPSLASASPAIASQEHRDQLTQAAGKLGREAMNVADVRIWRRLHPGAHTDLQTFSLE